VSLGCIRYLSSKHEHFVKFTGYAKNEQSGKKTHFEVIEHIRQGTTYKLIFMFIYIIVIASNEKDYKNKKQQQVHDERQPRGMIESSDLKQSNSMIRSFFNLEHPIIIGRSDLS
jgi:uncharacterized membrane protein